MQASKNYLIAFLFIAACAAGVLAWRQRGQILALRAQVAADDSANLRKRVAELERRNRSLADELAARGSGDQVADAGAAQDRGGRRARNFAAGFRAMLDNPQFQKLQTIQEKSQLDARYAALFKSLNLSPAQLDQFKSLLVQREQAARDATMAAFQQGINPRSDAQDFQQAVNDATGSIDQQIQAELGDAGYAAYQQYQQTLPERSTVNQVSQALSYSSTPLTDEQANQLVQILQQASPQGGNGGGGFGFGPGGGQGTTITSQALEQAQGVLSAPQMQALEQVQQVQQAQQQMRQLMRAARQNNGG